MTEWWQQTIENTKQKHSSIYMGNTIVQAMNPQKTQSCEGTLHQYVPYSNILSCTCTHFVYHCTINLKWQLCSFLVCNTNSQPRHRHNETIKMKNKQNKNKEQNKRLASTQTQINPSTVLVWTCNKQWHREACDWTGWTETSILSVKLTDSTCVYWKGWGGRGCSEWHTIVFYMKSTHIRPFGDIWHDK